MHKRVVVVVAALAALYLIWPYYTLWSLGQALHQQDELALQHLIDWPQVREGMRSQVFTIMKFIMGGEDRAAGADLGTALITLLGPTMINRLVEANVTPAALVKAASTPDSPLNPDQRHLVYAFFTDPTAFRADYEFTGPDGQPLTASLLLEFAGTGWKVTHVKLPVDEVVATLKAQAEKQKSEHVDKYTQPAEKQGREDVNQADLMAPGPLPDIVIGSADAPNTIVEYASMTCPHCAQFQKDVFPELKAKFIDTGKARYVFREFPLDNLAAAASMLARCSSDDHYYPMIETMFSTRENWAVPGVDAKDKLFQIAERFGISKEQFDQCLTDKSLFNKIVETRQVAHDKFHVDATPTFFVNGKRMRGDHQIKDFEVALGGAD